MEATARGIIFKEVNGEKCIVSIKRTKYINDGEYVYYTFPGGHVEGNETFEEAVIREIEEELGIKIKVKELFKDIFNEDLKRKELFYICEYISGEIGTGTGEEWQNVDYKKYGKYEICYIPISGIPNYNLLPKEIANEVYSKNI